MEVVECIWVPIGTGASDSAILSGECSDVLAIGTAASRNAYVFEAAGGHRIVNEGGG